MPGSGRRINPLSGLEYQGCATGDIRRRHEYGGHFIAENAVGASI